MTDQPQSLADAARAVCENVVTEKTIYLDALKAALARHEAQPSTDARSMNDDVLELLRALDISDHVRPTSCHRIVQDEILPGIQGLHDRLANSASYGEAVREQRDTLRQALRALKEAQPGVAVPPRERESRKEFDPLTLGELFDYLDGIHKLKRFGEGTHNYACAKIAHAVKMFVLDRIGGDKTRAQPKATPVDERPLLRELRRRMCLRPITDTTTQVDVDIEELLARTPPAADALTFRAWQQINAERNRGGFHGEDWSLTDWGCALAGEIGELCNVLKKRRRGDNIQDSAIKEEVGGSIAYMALLCNALGFDMGQCAAEEFDRVSDRIGWKGRRIRAIEAGSSPADIIANATKGTTGEMVGLEPADPDPMHPVEMAIDGMLPEDFPTCPECGSECRGNGYCDRCRMTTVEPAEPDPEKAPPSADVGEDAIEAWIRDALLSHPNAADETLRDPFLTLTRGQVYEAAAGWRSERERAEAAESESSRLANTLRDRIDEFGAIIDNLDKILKGDPDALAMDVGELARERMQERDEARAERRDGGES